MRKLTATAIFLLIVLAAIGADLVTRQTRIDRYLAEKRAAEPPTEERPIFPGLDSAAPPAMPADGGQGLWEEASTVPTAAPAGLASFRLPNISAGGDDGVRSDEPLHLTAVRRDGGIQLNWNPAAIGGDFVSYRIVRSETDPDPAWPATASFRRIADRTFTYYLDHQADQETVYGYRVCLEHSDRSAICGNVVIVAGTDGGDSEQAEE